MCVYVFGHRKAARLEVLVQSMSERRVFFSRKSRWRRREDNGKMYHVERYDLEDSQVVRIGMVLVNIICIDCQCVSFVICTIVYCLLSLVL